MAAIFETGGAVTATSLGTAVVGGSNAKSAWVQLIASTTIAAKMLWIHFRTGADASPYVLDIGTGTDGSETVVLPDLLTDNAGGAASGLEGGSFGPFRIDIPSGTRIAVRAEVDAVAAGDETILVTILLCDSEIPLLTSPTHASYGVTTGATPKGNTIDPGVTAHTKGAYTELTASAAASIQHLQLMFGNKNNTAPVLADFLIDIAIGSDGSETDIVSNLYVSTSAVTDLVLPRSVVIPGDNFGGQRISVRAQCSINDATDRLISVTALATSGTVPSGGSGAAQLVNSGALVG